jgi:hypothetical protein
MESEEIKVVEGNDDESASEKRRLTKSEFEEKKHKAEMRVSIVTGLVVLLLVAGWFCLRPEDPTDENALAIAEKEAPAAALKKTITAKQFAKAFMLESDVEKRLKMVRSPEVIRTHLERYADEALDSPGLNMRWMSETIYGGRAMTAYSVELESGDFRLLNVLNTDDGLKVDWDSFARYSSVSWRILAGGYSSGSAVVRVHVQPGFYYVGKYADQTKWLCFKLGTPDWRKPFYAYGRIEDEAMLRMAEVVKNAEKGGEYVTLKVSSKPKKSGANILEVEELLAVGWVIDYTR